MTVANTMLATSMFDRIKGPIQRIPSIFNNWSEVIISVERMEEFLQCEECQPNVLLRQSESSKENDVSIRIKGNYSWGTNPKTFDDK